ncbi:DUF533 domain-containing protein [Microbulbifer guangxiensis]|uniref:DUF533 domain-containing protein n=1 Tax=Microbulbifer guangxiensis TaxID=2904249 RepID=UPI001F28E3FF|nr:DUF533 domain-containing protein [Microbulbifer guangxiensis]
MNKKLLLGALIGAGMSMLNKKKRQQANPQPDVPPPDFSRVPPPTQRGVQPDSASLDDIFGKLGPAGSAAGGTAAPGAGGMTGSIPGGAAAAGGIGVFAEIARRIFEQMQQQSGGAAPGGAKPGGQPGGVLADILGQIFARNGGKFGQSAGAGGQGGGQPQSPGQWGAGLFQFTEPDARGEEQADLMLQAMIAAAQADGRIDEQEQQNIVASLQDQLDPSDLDELRELLTRPVDIESMVSKVQDPATAFNLYLVSAMTINEDNAAESRYMNSLAEKLGISEQAAEVIERQIPR